jgi:hypothetical protein
MGSGHTMDMIKRLRTNRSLRASNRKKFKNSSRETIHSKNVKKTSKSIFKTISQKELIRIKNRLKNKSEKINRKKKILSGTLCLIGLIILISLFLS